MPVRMPRPDPTRIPRPRLRLPHVNLPWLKLPKLTRSHLTRRRVVAGTGVAVLLLGLLTWAVWPAPSGYRTVEQMLTVRSGPAGDEEVRLDTTLYLPDGAGAGHRVPAILLAHGFGGTKDSVAADAADFARRGYAVLAYTARGFGLSGGQIHLNSPDYEVRDASRLLDYLASRTEIASDGDNDPRVGAVGGSYGGALALMLAGSDPRVDAIIPMITWNDLARAFLPESSGQDPTQGVFKRQWAGLFFGSGAGLGRLFTDSTSDPACGRFAKDVCAAYLDVATTGRASPATIALLQRSSPAPVLGKITAPTLLIQGQADSLFPLSEAQANYRGIAANGTPVRMDWYTGGHDGGTAPQADTDRIRYLSITWLDHYLLGRSGAPGTGFTYSRITGLDAETRRITTSAYSSPLQPESSGAPAPLAIAVGGGEQRIANPPSGNPAAVSSLPGTGTGSLASLVNGSALEIPGQHADFYSDPLAVDIDVIGTPTIQVRAASPTGEAVLFAKLYDFDPASGASLPFGLASPVRLTGLPASIDDAAPVPVNLPTIVYRFEAGHRLRITLSTSDAAYSGPATPTVYTVALPAEGTAVTLPQLVGTPIPSPEVIWRYVLVALLALVLAGLVTLVVLARRRRQRSEAAVVPDREQTPLVVRGLRKEYSDGFVAVAQAGFTVERGQVVGLLGPNGAGKTTTLRVLLGMIEATEGEVLIFGHRLHPGAAVLTRVGALVEGPGFLPHLSGLANLRLYWSATGRPAAAAHLDEALEIAGLGTAIHRKVRKYSHGMKQRLAIAQAMLGLPDLLVLDEPTDGLDPPQIAAMRQVLRTYANGSRAVLVSSHLLAEVEQTCTHVVVMHLGEVVADGPVADVVGDSPVAHFEVTDVGAASTVLSRLDGVRSVTEDGRGGLLVDLDSTPRTRAVEALVTAGVGVDRVVPRRRLEDAFLALVGDTKAGEIR